MPGVTVTVQIRLLFCLTSFLFAGALAPVPGIAAPPAASSIPTPIPEAIPFTGYVVDGAHLLSPEEIAHSTEVLGRFQRETRHQMAFVTIPDLGRIDIKTFATRLGNHWGVGRKHYDDGILLLIAVKQRQSRIAVGRGLEQILTDAFCANVMERIMVPALHRRDFAGAFDRTASALIGRLDQERHSVR